MATVNEIFRFLGEYAPLERKMDFDNVGFLVGCGETQVKKILVSLDITNEVIAESDEIGAQLIVSHHPLFFSIKNVSDQDRTGAKITGLLTRGMSAICMHTNLDAADGGVNDALAKTVGLCDTELLVSEGVDFAGIEYCCGRIGQLPEPVAMSEFLPQIKERINTRGLRYHSSGKPVHKVAVVGGSGGSYLDEAIKKGCDTLITSDVKYDVFLEAKERGINLIDGDHFCTENVVVPVLRDILMSEFPEVITVISEVHGQTVYFA